MLVYEEGDLHSWHLVGL